MPFFLLGIGADGRLNLLGDTAHPDRQAALAELSRLTAEPTFDRWDDEVLVIDTDSGTPVLLVRPVAAPMSVAEASDAELGLDAALRETAPVESPAGVEETPDEIAAVLKDLDEDETVSVVVADDDTVLEAPEPAWADAMVDTAAEEPVTLRDALLRTAVHMESEGISAPESVGPEEPAVTAGTEGAEEPGEPVTEVAPDAIDEVPASEAAEAVVEGAAIEAAEPAVEEATAEPAAEEDAAVGEEAAVETGAPAWPWDSPVAESPASEGADIAPAAPIAEEPVEADASEVTEEVAGEVVLVDEVVLDEIVLTPEGDLIEELTVIDEFVVVEDAGPVDSDVPVAPVAEEASVQPETPAEQPEPASDFIELDPVPLAEPAPVYEPGTVDMTDMTCDDCVYVETCPNKDDRTPATCGSFQWK